MSPFAAVATVLSRAQKPRSRPSIPSKPCSRVTAARSASRLRRRSSNASALRSAAPTVSANSATSRSVSSVKTPVALRLSR